jgi:hypothetical protein
MLESVVAQRHGTSGSDFVLDLVAQGSVPASQVLIKSPTAPPHSPFSSHAGVADLLETLGGHRNHRNSPRSSNTGAGASTGGFSVQRASNPAGTSTSTSKSASSPRRRPRDAVLPLSPAHTRLRQHREDSADRHNTTARRGRGRSLQPGTSKRAGANAAVPPRGAPDPHDPTVGLRERLMARGALTDIPPALQSPQASHAHHAGGSSSSPFDEPGSPGSPGSPRWGSRRSRLRALERAAVHGRAAVESSGGELSDDSVEINHETRLRYIASQRARVRR